MLDRIKLVAQITNSANHIKFNQNNQLVLALKTWQQISCDHEFKSNLLSANLPFSVPVWQGSLGEFKPIYNQKINYTVVSSDGSQIYPDRHMGSNYYLINTGIITLRYNDRSSINLASEPYFFTDMQGSLGSIADYVDSKRHDLEIQDGLKTALQEAQLPNFPVVYLADGSLIAWHLFGKGDNLREQFLPSYLAQLEKFYLNKLPFIGYVSLPNSTDLVNLLRAKIGVEQLLNFVDSDFLQHVLPVHSFTIWFNRNVSAAKDYPEHLKPYFAYFNTGHEIARVEVPSYVWQDANLLKLSIQVVFDQVHKGYGYPVALSEAHVQAVVKNEDRSFFYQVVNQVTKTNGANKKISRKLHKKQVMNI